MSKNRKIIVIAVLFVIALILISTGMVFAQNSNTGKNVNQGTYSQQLCGDNCQCECTGNCDGTCEGNCSGKCVRAGNCFGNNGTTTCGSTCGQQNRYGCCGK